MMTKNIATKIEQALDYMQNDTIKAIAIFDDILEYDPDNIEAINGKGCSLMKLNEFDEAEKYFDQSLTIEKTSSALINKGIIAKSRKEYKKSLSYYDKAIQVQPELNNIITILKNDIFNLIDMEIEIDFNDFNPRSNELIKKGLEYKNSERLWDALDCYQKAIEIDNNCENTVQALINEIKTILQNELMINTPTFGNSKINQLKIKSLKLLLIEENPEEALNIVNQILKETPNEIDTINQKGCILFIFDEFDHSIECFDKCLNLNSKCYYALFNKGLILRRINKLEESLECFNELLKVNVYPEKVNAYHTEILEKIQSKKKKGSIINLLILKKKFKNLIFPVF